jgi:hypothetical protein
VELRFEDGDARHPIIVAMAPERPPEAAPRSPRPAPAEASDAAARIIQGKDGLILRCGEASLTLLRNGKVAHRIKGASVHINPPTAPEARPDSVPELSQLASADLQVIQGKESLVLQCGRASITLLCNGRISIKGTYVETCAEGINHIMGGSVRIN